MIEAGLNRTRERKRKGLLTNKRDCDLARYAAPGRNLSCSSIIITAAEVASPLDTASQAHHIAAGPAVGIDAVDRPPHTFQVPEVAAWVDSPADRVEQVPALAGRLDKAADLVDKVDIVAG